MIIKKVKGFSKINALQTSEADFSATDLRLLEIPLSTVQCLWIIYIEAGGLIIHPSAFFDNCLKIAQEFLYCIVEGKRARQLPILL